MFWRYCQKRLSQKINLEVTGLQNHLGKYSKVNCSLCYDFTELRFIQSDRITWRNLPKISRVWRGGISLWHGIISKIIPQQLTRISFSPPSVNISYQYHMSQMSTLHHPFTSLFISHSERCDSHFVNYNQNDPILPPNPTNICQAKDSHLWAPQPSILL